MGKHIVTFKQNWEQASFQHKIKSEYIHSMLSLAFGSAMKFSFEAIPGGCANLNYYVNADNKTFVLRVYIRDKDTAYKEQKLSTLIMDTIPIPQFYSVGDYQGYRFAILEHLPGISLRDLLLSEEPHDLAKLMFDVGLILTQIRTHHFNKAGFFDKDLNVSQPIKQSGYLEYAADCLNSEIVLKNLPEQLVNSIRIILERFHSYFPDEKESNLVHADFDPANILVAHKNNQWQISGVLDWEFAFSGSSLCDVANMLRYAHQMPIDYKQSFIQGLKHGNYLLPDNWEISAHILNLLSLLDCLTHITIERPNQQKDICELLAYIIKQLDTFAK